ncbi:MAG: phosphatidylinositol mannoside acyltransferase [Corynebacterium sp.]|uniref:phosphatidylinositol mannoside acyltransferase n=1 Tax=Corynebacterium sp. TaxID=1720 RepID=UPI0026DA8FB3|nr:phosphatidylinositol mannoside acyltransferase [Corynebacterium sp.]MDO4760297.1 phosphatidylinositol mannoside acyltransferase [Corynebacterium sp.]
MKRLGLVSWADVKSAVSAQGYLLGWKCVGWLPLPVAAWIFRVGADCVSDRGRGMDQLRRNLSRVVGAENVTRELVRDSVRSYTRYWLEAFRLPKMCDDLSLVERMDRTIEGKEHLLAAAQKKSGTVIVLSHSGNWDMAGLYLVRTCGSFSTVAERLKPTEVFDAFVDFRTKLGFEVLPHVGPEGESPYPVLVERAREGGIVCLLGERDLKGRGVEVEFFGEKTTMPIGAVRLAQETNSTLLVAHTWFLGSDTQPGWGIRISAPVDTSDLVSAVQQQARLIEENIAKNPVDWHVLQPLWIADRDRRPAQK